MIKINLDDYEIEIKNNLINELPEKILKHYQYKDIYIITDKNVYHKYEAKLNTILKDFKVFWVVLKPGERSKSFKTYQKTVSELISKGIKRNNLIIALGGGVVGDLAGFIASSLYRGLPFIQIPTTLLSQVDSSVGGKTGIDLSYGKNLVGAFYNPKYVLIDPEFLKTLKRDEYINGVAEMIKVGLIGDVKLYKHLKEFKEITAKEIAMAINVKKKLVTEDPFDQGSRMLLNFGHTFGHAIEKKHHYKKYSHGKAISYGMLMAIKSGIEENITPKPLYGELKNIFLNYGLVKMPLLERKKYRELIKYDKKNIAGQLNFIVLKTVGQAEIITLEKEIL